MDADKPDWHICERCFASYRFGLETMVFMFADRPDLDYIITICPAPACRIPQIILGVGKELFDSFQTGVNIVRKQSITQDHRCRALSGLDIGEYDGDFFARDLRLEMHAEYAKSLFPRQEE